MASGKRQLAGIGPPVQIRGASAYNGVLSPASWRLPLAYATLADVLRMLSRRV
jgi:hypothetical protein